MANRAYQGLRVMKYFFMLVMFVTLCISCTPAQGPRVQLKRPTIMPARVVKLFHADINHFNVFEREIIDDSVKLLNEQMNGVGRVGVIYDLDWSAKTANTDYAQFDQLHRVYSNSTAVEKQDKQMPNGNVVLGWADVEFNNPKYATRVNLVVDRLETEWKYKHVVMHEILHALRLQHVPGKQVSVMYWQTNGPEPTTCMSYFDAAELCRVYRCKVEEISYCE